jgi:hypothetical protein
MRRNLSLIVFVWFSLLGLGSAFSQNMYNQKNVDRTAMSFFDGQQTFRALEYSTDPGGSNKVYRLQTLPENGFPAINLQGVDAGNFVYFEDKMPQDDQYTDNLTPYFSSEAVQLMFGFQSVMKAFDQRFGWKGIDGTGTEPVNVYMINSDENPLDPPVYAQFLNDTNEKLFQFARSVNDNKPFNAVLEVIAHEYAHAIFHSKTGIINDNNYLCQEYRTLNEGIADILGIYVKNKIIQSTPQTYDWKFKNQVKNPAEDFANPKGHEFADTYNGEYYVNVCSEAYDPHPGAGIAQKWFYLLTTGFASSAYNDLGYGYSNLQGIGVEKAIQVVWDAIPALTVQSDYPSFKVATLKAAEQLYGANSTEYLAVQNAWCAVGVCDNNLVGLSVTPANMTEYVSPWPGVDVNVRWLNEQVGEWEVQMSTKFDFSENLQTIKVSNYTTTIDQNGNIQYTAKATGYYLPGQRVYARAWITNASPNFCRGGINPLCSYYKQFTPTNSFLLNDQHTSFYWAVKNYQTFNPWTKPELTWKTVYGAEKFTLQVANDSAFADIVYSGTVNYTGNIQEKGQVDVILGHGKKYYTRVRAERNNTAQLSNNFAAWSSTDSFHTWAATGIVQAQNQNGNDPATVVSNLGFHVGWYPVGGASGYVVQVAVDAAFSNMVRQQSVAGNLTSTDFILPVLANQSQLFVRVLPKRGNDYGACEKAWRIQTSETLAKPAMTMPANGSPISYKNYLGATFEWQYGNLNDKVVDHFELHLTEKSTNISCIYNTGKVLDFWVKDQLMFDDKQGISVSVLAVNALGVKSVLSAPFNYTICPDHPYPKFPSDDKIDPSKNLTITWESSLWKEPSDNYLVTIADAAGPIPGFNNAATMGNSMVVPAGTLANNSFFNWSVKNSAGCVGIDPPKAIFSTIAAGNNQPQPPALKNFTVELHAFRNDADLNFIPPAFETSDYVMGVELFDPNGVKVNVVDVNGPVTQLLVDSENSILAMAATMQPAGKYTLKLKILNIFNQLDYFPFDQPRFSVFLDGQSVLLNHIIKFNPLDPASPFHEWQNNYQFEDIILDVK